MGKEVRVCAVRVRLVTLRHTFDPEAKTINISTIGAT